MTIETPLHPAVGSVQPDRPRRRYVVTATVAVVALILGLLGPWIWAKVNGPSAKDVIEADPPPTLFSAAAIKPVDVLVDPQQAKAHRLMKAYWASHGSRADDAVFTRWLERHFPEPPVKAQRMRELSLLEAQDRQHTAAGVKAATWLEVHGKKDIWKLYAHDQAEWLPTGAGDTRKSEVKALLKMAKKVSHDLGPEFGASAPYVLEPALEHKPHNVVNGCPCSYPSHHSAKAAAVRTYLTAFQPHMVDQYRWMEDEIDWSRIYMAGHVPSDIAGGALLGDMIGEYFLVTRAHRAPAERS